MLSQLTLPLVNYGGINTPHPICNIWIRIMQIILTNSYKFLQILQNLFSSSTRKHHLEVCFLDTHPRRPRTRSWTSWCQSQFEPRLRTEATLCRTTGYPSSARNSHVILLEAGRRRGPVCLILSNAYWQMATMRYAVPLNIFCGPARAFPFAAGELCRVSKRAWTCKHIS